MKQRWDHSLRWRLQAWHGLLLLLVVTATIWPTYRLLKENEIQRIDQELAAAERSLVRALMHVTREQIPSPGGSDARFIAPSELHGRITSGQLRIPDDLLAIPRFQPGDHPAAATASHENSAYYYLIRDAEQRTIAASSGLPDDLHFLDIPDTGAREEARSTGQRREFARSSAFGLQVVVGRDISAELQSRKRTALLHLGTGLGVWLVGMLGGWWVAGRAIRPIRTISETATQIAEGNLEQRIDISEMDRELAQLSQVLNDTFERLRAAFERQKQFTADASHELRTPLSILITETQRTLKRPRTAEEYREALEVCGSTAQRMRRLVEALLLMARQDTMTGSELFVDCDLFEIAGQVTTDLLPLAAETGHNLTLEGTPLPVHGDPERLYILLSNLIHNGLSHGGDTCVECFQENREAVVRVTDQGKGISPQDLPHLFERFYRADTVRTGDTLHSGLGLSISQTIATNHGGSLLVKAEASGGAVFEFRMSVAPPA